MPTENAIRSKNHILIFDSGVGGLSLVKHIQQRLPDTVMTYLADNALFPYGLLDEETLIKRVCQLVGELCQQYPPDLVVIGCNSASTLVLPSLRKQLSIPVVGVVPAIKPAARLSQSKVIGLLATPGTIQREYTDELIASFAPNCSVIRVGSTALVEAVEHQLSGYNVDQQLYQSIADDFLQQPQAAALDTIVLACTHFPHAKQALQTALPQIKHWVDSGEAIARRVDSLLQQQTADQPANNHRNRAFFTCLDSSKQALGNNLKQFGFPQAVLWPHQPAA